MVTVKRDDFSGAWTGNPIPFTDSDEVADEEYRRHIEFVVRGGVRGLLPGSLVGSGIQLTHSERLRVIRSTVDQVSGRANVFPMVYTPAGTKNTILFMREMEELGADGAYLPTPILWQCGPEAIHQHFRAVLTATRLPVVFYNCPETTGTRLPASIVKILIDEFGDRVRGYKQHEMDGLADDVALLGSKIGLAPACFDRFTLRGLRVGCRAQVSIGGSLVPSVVSEVFSRWEHADRLGAEALLQQFEPLFAIPPISFFTQHRDYYAGVYVHMLNRMGFAFGQPRLPYLWPLPGDLADEINVVLDQLNLTGSAA